ncbi:hypothetical protein [Parachryseolinea silvisoli]|uniref:hypothetical protein n=1 Tax=Parachryseolinea silvisoli TaxID=2873601 RepID=UPI00226597D3|nr:hypothetical protein [Parachryseolinea silvisoli]MCD9015473.1 hypothetical protein [Parachryseolinea silvisoli]
MTLFRNSAVLRAFSVFCLIELFVNIIAPSVSWALTSGPTAPEATSFEPVDTTDLVSLNTGDFTYTLPLIDVPGPAGGYPLALAYHAGIMPDEDATFVGLGFSLNPGAINRSVSGFADDANNVSTSTREFWQGGSTTTVTVGVSVSSASGVGVSAGLIFSDDTYRGRGVGHYYGGRYAIKQSNDYTSKLSKSIHHTQGVSPYGDRFSSTGVTLGIGKVVGGGTMIGLSATISQDQNGDLSGSMSAGISANSNTPKEGKQGYGGSLLGASISTSQSSVSVSAGGVSAGATSTNKGNVSTSGSDIDVDIPLPGSLSLRLGRSYQRYWIDKTESVASSGALYFPDNLPTSTELNTRAYDVYDLTDPNKSIAESVPDEGQVGAFIDYDNFNVVAQGLAGTMRPFHYKAALLRKNRKSGETVRVKSYPLAVNKKPHFRFIGDFSNRYEHDRSQDQFAINSNSSNPLSFSFDSNRQTGESGSDAYDTAANILPGSKNIEWFTNTSIRYKWRDEQGNPLSVPPSAAIKKGFVDCKALGFVRNQNDKIGGFKVTNESGVSYHYALPAYSRFEQQYSGQIDDANKHQFSLFKNPEEYAYAWLLTAVTGPDYVDTNTNGFADQGDFGYWVTFNYGKWSGSYKWRNPGTGFNKDIDQNFDNVSKGQKDVYYLNSISTQTHTALFVKGFRSDGKGVVPKNNDIVITGSGTTVREIDDGGYDPRYNENTQATEYPVSTLKLDRIYLMLNKDLGGGADKVNEMCDDVGNLNPVTNAVNRSNVLDSLDVRNSQALLAKAIKKIVFTTDYSLCPNTENSYYSLADAWDSGITASAERKGKLTLKAIRVYGRNGVSLLPPTKFTYGKEEQMSGTMNYVGAGTVTIDYPERFNIKKGDILRFQYLDKFYFCYLNGVVYSGGTYGVTPLNYSTFPAEKSITTILTRTKNPPYSQNHQDLWGNYKVDWAPNEIENVERMVTTTSATQVDAWSLTEISTALGSKLRVEYESDKYKNALKSLSNIPIKSVEALPNGRTRIHLYEDLAEYGLKQGDAIHLRTVTAARYEVANPSQATQNRFDCNGVKQTYVMQWKFNNRYDVTNPSNTRGVQAVNANTFEIDFDVTDGFPRGDDLEGVCFNEAYPYNAEDGNHSATCIGYGFINFKEWQFIGGEIISKNFFSPYGGGIRVKKISLVQEGRTRSTIYEYQNGVTTYEPLGFAVPLRKIPNSQIYQCLEQKQQEMFNLYRDSYRMDVFERFRFLFANSRELPGPNVLYGKVTMREQIERREGITDLPGRTGMEFEVFSPETILSNPSLAGAFQGQFATGSSYGGQTGSWSPTPVGNVLVENIVTRNTTSIRDFSSIMGSLKRTTLYDAENNKINETVNHYLHDNFSDTTFIRKLGTFKNQGVITETFADARAIIQPNTDANPRYKIVASIAQKIKYPSLQTGTTTINYKTGITTKSINRAFDYYSGNVTEVVTSDGFGNAYLQKTVPAYKSYGGITGEMGLGTYGGKNMLAQGSETWVYKVDTVNYETRLGLVSGSVQTWSDEIRVIGPGQDRSSATTYPGIWRKYAAYVFTGNDDQTLQADGLYPVSQVTPFNAWNIDSASPAGWERIGALTLADVFSAGLEEVDMEGRFGAVKMSKDHSQVFAEASNAKYEEFAFSGAEEDVNNGQKFGGDVLMRGLMRTSTSHTGKWGVQADASGLKAKGFSYSFAPQKKLYHVGVWCNRSTSVIKYKFDNSATELNAKVKVSGQAGDWYLLEADISVGSGHTNLEVWCEALPVQSGPQTVFDDFRIHPSDAVMSSYVYDDMRNVSFILGNNNLFSEFRYDEAGRLVSTLKESFQRSFGNDGREGIVKVTDFNYHYGSTSPKTVTFQASANGPTASILPAGSTQVPQGGDIIFDVTGACPANSYLQSVVVDGMTVSTSNPELILGDGTRLEMLGHMLKFGNVQTGHTVVANFLGEAALGTVECVQGVPLSDGTTCYNGQYRYGYFNACGEVTQWSYAWQKIDIPQDLRGLALDNCCTRNPPGSTCTCPDW